METNRQQVYYTVYTVSTVTSLFSGCVHVQFRSYSEGIQRPCYHQFYSFFSGGGFTYHLYLMMIYFHPVKKVSSWMTEPPSKELRGH